MSGRNTLVAGLVLASPGLLHAQEDGSDRLSIDEVGSATQAAGLPIEDLDGVYGGPTQQGVYFANVSFEHAGVPYVAEALVVDMKTGDLWIDNLETTARDRGVISAQSVSLNFRTLGAIVADDAWPDCGPRRIDLQPDETRIAVAGLVLQADRDMLGNEPPEISQVENIALTLGNRGEAGSCDLTAEWRIEDFRSQSAAMDRIEIDEASGSAAIPNYVLARRSSSAGEGSDLPAPRAISGRVAFDGVRMESGTGVSLGQADHIGLQIDLSGDYLDPLADGGDLSALPFPFPDADIAFSTKGLHVPVSGVYTPASGRADALELVGDGTFGLRLSDAGARLGAFLDMPGSIEAKLNLETSFSIPDTQATVGDGLFERLAVTVLDKALLELSAPIVEDLKPGAPALVTSKIMAFIDGAPIPARVKTTIAGMEDGIRDWLEEGFSRGTASVSLDPPNPVNLAAIGAAFAIRPQIAANTIGFSLGTGNAQGINIFPGLKAGDFREGAWPPL